MYAPHVAPEEGLSVANRNIGQFFVSYIFLLYVFRLLRLSLTAVRISRSIYFFPSLRSASIQSLYTRINSAFYYKPSKLHTRFPSSLRKLGLV